MAYNNGFQETYQNGYLQNNFQMYPYGQYGVNQNMHSPMYGYQNTMNQMSQNQQQNNTGLIWVQGEAGAKAFSNLRPDTPVALWDSEEPVIYIKSIDNTGKPSMTIIDYKERGTSDEKHEEVQVEYATKEQIDNLSAQYSEFTTQLKELSGHVKDIENRITSFGKPQQNTNNRRGNK